MSNHEASEFSQVPNTVMVEGTDGSRHYVPEGQYKLHLKTLETQSRAVLYLALFLGFLGGAGAMWGGMRTYDSIVTPRHERRMVQIVEGEELERLKEVVCINQNWLGAAFGLKALDLDECEDIWRNWHNDDFLDMMANPPTPTPAPEEG